MRMLAKIKWVANNTAKTNKSLANYYQSRLRSSRSLIEVEAILAMNIFLSFEEEKQQSKILK